ncbi:MAG: hypothetical protein CL878_06265 [Dehalococcoidia bacterium]|nr:hypothetical protein [Dehalococcoidia bacterium]
MASESSGRLRTALILALVVGAVLSLDRLLHFIPGLDGLQTLYSDAVYFQSRANRPATNTVLVEIDEDSIQALTPQFGRFFSWPRSLHGRVIANLTNAGARVIVVDILFDAPGDAAEDQALAEAIAASGRVILPMAGTQPATGHLADGEPPTYGSAVTSLPEFAAVALGQGHVHPDLDSDGSVREIPLTIKAKGEEIPAVSLAAVSAFLQEPQVDNDRLSGRVTVGDRRIPVDSHGRMIVNYLGQPSHRVPVIGEGPVPVIAFLDVLNNEFDQELARDKIVFVGLTALGFADDFQVPTSSGGLYMSGVEIHAHATETIIQGSFLSPQGTLTTILAVIVISLIAGLALGRLPPTVAGAVVAVLFVAAVLIVPVLLTTSSTAQAGPQTITMFNVIYPAVGLVVSSVAVMFYRYRAVYGALQRLQREQ